MKVLLLILLTTSIGAQIIDPDQIHVMRNENTGIKEYEYNIKSDSWLLDLAYTFNPNPLRSGELSGFRSQLTSFSDSYSWTGYFAKSTGYIDNMMSFRGDFDAAETLITITEMGLGLSRRSNIINDFWANKDVYDELSVIALYSQASSADLTNKFAGYGLLTSYSVLYRPSPSYHLGARLGYHIHTLEDASDALNVVKATANWVSLDASIGFYF